ncbi:MAG: hypothetical protein AAF497_18895 [Planctomycetota bacterium]
MIRLSRLVLCAFALSSNLLWAQAAPNPDCWSGDPNPDGSQLVPVVEYEPDTGLLFVNTLGLNQVLDTSSRFDIGGDDVGMISMSVEGPEPTDFLLTGFLDGIVWNGQYFAGKAQLFGVGAGAEFLRPDARTYVFQYETGLTMRDFGVVEMAVNYATGIPGGIIFGRVSCIPEPSSWSLILVCCLAVTHRVRRIIRRSQPPHCVGSEGRRFVGLM